MTFNELFNNDLKRKLIDQWAVDIDKRLGSTAQYFSVHFQYAKEFIKKESWEEAVQVLGGAALACHPKLDYKLVTSQPWYTFWWLTAVDKVEN